MHAKDTRRTWLAAVVAAAVVMGRRPAVALPIPLIPVVDPTRAVEMAKQLQEALNLYNQLVAGIGVLRDAAQRLTDLPESPQEVLSQYRSLTSDVNMIGYRIATVTRQYRQIFPDEQAVRNTPSADMARLGETWDRELYMSSLAAERSQATLSSIEGNTRTTTQLLERSNGSSSAVAQLQALVHMIELINSDLEQLSLTLAATERVNSSLAATGASSRDATAERQNRLLEQFAPPLHTDGISADFLRDN